MSVCAEKEGSVYRAIYISQSSCSMAAGKTYAAIVCTAEIVQIPVNQNSFVRNPDLFF